MDGSEQYVVRDGMGNLYGPAGGELLRSWVREGRIIAGMGVAKAGGASGTEAVGPWVEATLHPELMGEFARLPTLPPGSPVAGAGVGTAATPTSGGMPAGEATVRRTAEFAPTMGYAPVTAQPRGTMLPLVSVITGGIGLLISFIACCGCFAIPLGLTAITTGGISLFQMRVRNAPADNQWLAVAGVVLGFLAILVTILMVVVMFRHNVTIVPRPV